MISVSGKDGLLRLLDRNSHDQFYEVPITTRENVDALPTVEGVHRCPGPARRHGVERAGLRSRQQHAVRSGRRLVRHLQQGAQGPADHAGHALLRRLGCLGPAREVERLADRVRRLDRQGALEICLAHAARRGRHRDLGRRALHRRSQQRLPRSRCQDRRRALPLQHRRQHRRRRDHLCARRQAICRDDVRNRVGLLRRLGPAGDRHLRRR